MATAKTTTTASVADVTGNPAAATNAAKDQVTVKVAGYDDDRDVTRIEVSGLHTKPLRFELPGHPTAEHTGSLLTNVIGRWQRVEDRQELIDTHA